MQRTRSRRTKAKWFGSDKERRHRKGKTGVELFVRNEQKQYTERRQWQAGRFEAQGERPSMRRVWLRLRLWRDGMLKIEEMEEREEEEKAAWAAILGYYCSSWLRRRPRFTTAGFVA
jgi:hypothetical protein